MQVFEEEQDRTLIRRLGKRRPVEGEHFEITIRTILPRRYVQQFCEQGIVFPIDQRINDGMEPAPGRVVGPSN